MAKSFEEIGQTAKDVLHGDYRQDKEVRFVGKKPDGTVIECTVGEESTAGSFSSAGLMWTYRRWEWFAGMWSDGSIKISAAVDQLENGLKFLGSGVLSIDNGLTGSAQVLYNGRMTSSSLRLSSSKNNSYEAAGEVTLIYEGVSLGASTSCSIGSTPGTKLDSEAILCYTDGDESEVSVSITNDPIVVKGTYYHNVSRDLRLAAQADYDVKTHARIVTMGTAVQVDPSCRFKAKVNSAGLLSACFVQELRAGLRLGLSSTLHVTELEKGHTLGLELNYEP